MNMIATRTVWRAMPVAALCTLLASCTFVIQTVPPKPPTPFELATSLQVAFDYSTMLVEGMGGAKSEAEWVKAKSAEDPQYPKTWADLKAKWEASFMQGLASGSPVPVSRAPAAPAEAAPAAASLSVEGPVLFAQASPTGTASDAPSSNTTAGGEAAVATDANVAAPAAEPAPAAAPEPPPFDGVLTVRVSLAQLKMGKYIPMFVTNAEVHVMNTWWASGKSIEGSSDTAAYVPTMSTPSVFQHIQTLGLDAGGRAGTFLRKRH